MGQRLFLSHYFIALAAFLSLLTACQNEQASLATFLPGPLTTQPLFDNSITLVETPGSRALNEGIFYTPTDIKKAKADLTEAASPGVPNDIRSAAYREYGKILRFENGNQFDAKSLDLLFTAHKLGDPQATRILADYALTQNRPAEAIGLLQPIYASYTPAKALLGQIYLTQGNQDGARLVREAIAEYHQALALGDKTAHASLGEVYSNPAYGQFNPVLAVRHYEQAIAIGDQGGYWPLAEFYRTANGVAPDHEKALAYYTHLANAGNAGAARMISLAYSEGGWIGADPVKETQWWLREEKLRTAVHQPAVHVRLNLGKAYAIGHGVEKDLKTSQAWFDKVVAEDSTRIYHIMRFLQLQNTPEANDLAAMYYAKGLEIHDPATLAYQDKMDARAKKEAYQALVRLNRGGHKFQSLAEVEAAATNLRAHPEIPTDQRYFVIGDGYVNFGHYTEGLPLLRQGAQKGSVDAMKRLSRLYASGEGVKQDFHAAFEWMQKAAKTGDTEAEYYTGLAYAQALGVEKDREKARQWLSRSASGGNQSATAVLNSLHGETAP